jgi:hypothetical protein
MKSIAGGLFILLSCRAHAALPALPLGNSAWAYTMDATNASEISSYEAKLQPASNGHFKYFFPDCASVAIGPAGSKSFVISPYGSASSMVAFYNTQLPNAMIMPIIESGCAGNCGTIFDGWSSADMQMAADTTATFVINTAATWGTIGGIHIDLETYSDLQLPYYLELRQKLNAAGYRMSFFAPVSSNAQFFNAADFIVFSGYDLGGTGGVAESPTLYGTKLGNDVAQLINLANSTGGGHLMVGIPLAASTTEFETYQCGACAVPTSSGYSQSQYVSEAAAALCPYVSNPAFLGVSAWVMELTSNTYTPTVPSPASWSILAGMGTQCATTSPVAPSRGTFKVSGVLGAPNPSTGPGSLCFNFNAEAASGRIEIFSAAYTKVWQQDLPAADLGAGEHCLPFSPAQAGLANGLYYLGVSADGADGSKSFLNSTFLILK